MVSIPTSLRAKGPGGRSTSAMVYYRSAVQQAPRVFQSRENRACERLIRFPSPTKGFANMFESLQQRLDEVFGRLSRKGKLTEKDVTDAMREVRQALLEADVNFKLVKQFVARVQERAVGADVLESLSPAQQVISIVYDELVRMLGGTDG